MRKVYLLFVILFTPLLLRGQESSLLFKLTGPGISKPSYIFGTIHMMCSEDYSMSTTVENAMTHVDRAVLEIDMDDPAMMMKIQQLSMNPGFRNISDQFSKSELDSLNAFLQKGYGATMTQFGVMKPFVLLTMILPKLLNCDEIIAFENEIVNMAKSNEIPVEGLETVEFQVGVFDSIPEADQIKIVNELIADKDKARNDFNKLLKAYKEKDVKQLAKLVVEDPQYADYADLLLYERNENWLPHIIDMAKEKPSLFAVGAGHLGGGKGVLHLLEEKGYTVEPVF
ncbi:TraB/GumN family protein [Fulvivirga sediminis]|uniref:TraB/GumN family protein n=1 Tax=Fulvivirga sediminis TaxID=2803949 RepID=A0A937K1G8_9BACT|nr:TraB/GumN family protein [Fulvivirga sediminis]MBL3656652.1 TraB/GumN family protein [Fulvivirga sediminis]